MISPSSIDGVGVEAVKPRKGRCTKPKAAEAVIDAPVYMLVQDKKTWAVLAVLIPNGMKNPEMAVAHAHCQDGMKTSLALARHWKLHGVHGRPDWLAFWEGLENPPLPSFTLVAVVSKLPKT